MGVFFGFFKAFTADLARVVGLGKGPISWQKANE